MGGACNMGGRDGTFLQKCSPKRWRQEGRINRRIKMLSSENGVRMSIHLAQDRSIVMGCYECDVEF
jgi:hypothetical protein